ncbi:Micrococcal nuclease-like nuclease (modular protein) [Agrobacterium fabacearum S56]|uniref:thermonuclease family protein n=1 Tax=Agrobacterium tumefaciens TaxID=358 RepID=UPI0009CA4FDE|nr:thermonuclease family protein [Agrobacterium tumefaciens]CUW90136.1 Micrococcal nuclease-like nuclease (modular protein) [Agrobacterium fabacearum S56]
MIRVLFSIGAAAAFTLFPVILTAGQGVSCASLIVIDGDTIKCDGQNMRLLGGGVPFKSGVDAPEMGSRAKCDYERHLALKAKARLKELLFAGVPRIEDSGARDRTQSRRPLINIFLPDGREAGQVLMSEGFAKPWHPKRRIDWCGRTTL